MHLFVITLAFLGFAAIAPLHVTLSVVVILILVPSIVRLTTKVIAGTEPSFLQAFKAVALSLFFVALSALMVGAAMGGIRASGTFALMLLGCFFCSICSWFQSLLRHVIWR